MNKKFFLCLILFLPVVFFQIRSAETNGSGKYIVVFEDWVDDSDRNAKDLARQFGLRVGHTYKHALKGFSCEVADVRLDDLKNHPDVKYINEDVIVSLIPPVDHPAGKNGDTSAQAVQVTPTGVNRVDAELSTLARIDGVDDLLDADIAVIDTGIDKNHPDLRVVSGVNFTSGNRNNFSDGNGHGTHVSGTAAARDNGIGVVGVAPGARLHAVKVLNNAGTGTLSGLIAGIDWVTSRASIIEVANMSLGFSEDPTQPSAVHDAIRRSAALGVVYVAAAGNSNADTASFAPASYEEVIAVSAVADSDGLPGHLGPSTSFGADDTLASFSNFGSAVDVAGPGVDILSTLPKGLYGKKSGTSMAAPHGTGVVALHLFLLGLSGKPTDAAGVASIRQRVIDSGFPQASLDGFTGDKDEFPEPLLKANF
jgi:subtilisin family serine protease